MKIGLEIKQEYGQAPFVTYIYLYQPLSIGTFLLYNSKSEKIVS